MVINLEYNAAPTLSGFLQSDAFVRGIVGPVGSGKSSCCIVEILRRARAQEPGPDGVRRTRFVVIRNTYSQLRDTTRKTFEQWVPDALGKWHEQAFTFEIKQPGLHCEVLFRALDRPEDVKKLLSLEVTGAYVNEAREIPKDVLDLLQTRVGRFPSKIQGGATWFGVWFDTNPWHSGHWAAKLFAQKPDGYELYRQPGGRSAEAENVDNLPQGYYQRLIAGKDSEWIATYVDGEDPSSDVGSYWGKWIAALEQRGGVTAFQHPNTDVFTTWDLGRSDSTAIFFWRINQHGVADVIDHYEAHGVGLTHYLDYIDAKPYSFIKHWLPHDARAETLGSEMSILEQCGKRWGHGKIAIIPELSIQDGIDAGRWLLEQSGTRIHSRCGIASPGLKYSGLDALRDYRREWDDRNACFREAPLHNYASHTADAWRYTALVVKVTDLITRKPEPKPVVLARAPNSFTLDELWETARKGGR